MSPAASWLTILVLFGLSWLAVLMLDRIVVWALGLAERVLSVTEWRWEDDEQGGGA